MKEVLTMHKLNVVRGNYHHHQIAIIQFVSVRWEMTPSIKGLIRSIR